jgi:hypothetical protein
MRTTMWVPVSRLQQLQALVRQHDLRFRGNPLLMGDRAQVCVDGEHLPPGGCNPFWADWNRLITPIRETSTPSWKRFFRRMTAWLR